MEALIPIGASELVHFHHPLDDDLLFGSHFQEFKADVVKGGADIGDRNAPRGR